MGNDFWGAMFDPNTEDMEIVFVSRDEAWSPPLWKQVELKCKRCSYNVVWRDITRDPLGMIILQEPDTSIPYHRHRMLIRHEDLLAWYDKNTGHYYDAQKYTVGGANPYRDALAEDIPGVDPPDDKGITWEWSKVPEEFSEFINKLMEKED